MFSQTKLQLAGVEHLFTQAWLMGVVNATPDSFSDRDLNNSFEEQLKLALRLIDDGADVIDIGGESSITNVDAVAAEAEIARVVPLISGLSQHLKTQGLKTLISVDTYKPAVARAALDAGAQIINDVSGLADPELADLAAEYQAGLVIMHTAAAPKVRLQRQDLYRDIVEEVYEFLAERVEVALSRGVAREQIIIDVGPDFTKTPAQTVELLQAIDRFRELGCPLLFAVSRKDFIGAITERKPRERGSGTLAAFAYGLDHQVELYRLHDVAAAKDYLKVRRTLRGQATLAADVSLTDDLRYQQTDAVKAA